MAYKMTDRLKEWTSYAGVAVGAIGVAIPQLVPAAEWTHFWADAQIILGAALILLPQTAGTTAVESDALALVQALSDKVPPQYQSALRPFLVLRTRAAVQPHTAPAVPAVPVPPPAPVPQQPLPADPH